MTVALTFTILLVTQALHLVHHRIAKRHISYVEGVTGIVLCVPIDAAPAWLMMGAHLSLVAIQIVGSVAIDRLSPTWDESPKA